MYILDSTLKKLNKYELLVYATENFAQLLYYLQKYRNYTNCTLKIGTVKYDDWEADIFCILDKTEIYFKHIRLDDKREWKNTTLTEQFIYAWGFDTDMEININFDIINQYWSLLTKKEKKSYDEIYDDVHIKFF